MEHPIQSGNVLLSVTNETVIETEVMGVAFNEVDKSFHYSLQAVFKREDGSAATVQIGDVHQSLIILPD